MKRQALKKLIAVPTLLLTLLINNSVFAADLDRGMEAYERGDYPVALRELKPLAEQGWYFAQFLLGMMYGDGKGVQRDDRASFTWIKLSAQQGFDRAQHNLAVKYDNGKGIKKDTVAAIKWYERAANQGFAGAQFNLGVKYSTGRGVPQDNKKSFKWMKLAAEQGLDRAQYNLGVDYAKGRGVQQDIPEALRWFRLAAEKGNKGAVKAINVIAQLKYPPALKRNVPSTSPRETTSARSETANVFPAKPVNANFRNSSRHPDDIAVIIGNANYGKQGKDIPNVTPAYADAEGIKRYFMDRLGIREGNIIHLKDATGSQLISVFGNRGNHKGKLFNWVKPGRSKVYVYYAGHGAPAGDEGSAYIIPSDSSVESIELTGYPLATLYKNLGKIPAKSVTVILEACFSGAGQSGTLISNASPVYLKAKTPKIPSNLTVISAGAANQIASWEKDKSHSLFTKYFLKGMSGEADKGPYGNGDGKVSYAELGKYLDGTMTYYARRYYGRDQKAQIVNGG